MQELEDGSGHFVLASDGVWEFLTNEDVSKIVHSSWTATSRAMTTEGERRLDNDNHERNNEEQQNHTARMTSARRGAKTRTTEQGLKQEQQQS